MPNFSAAFTEGVTLVPWEDPPTATRPTRINPIANRRHLRRVAAPNTLVTVTASVFDTPGLPDVSLGGKLFIAWFAEHVDPMPVITSPAGQSAVQQFTPVSVGHYTFVMRRDSGGAVILHLDVEN